MSQPRKRLKWEPGAAMALVLFLGAWLAFGPPSGPKFRVSEESVLLNVRVGTSRGVLEARGVGESPGGEPEFYLHMKGVGTPHRFQGGAEVRALFGDEVYDTVIAQRQNWVFKLLNITSWWNVVWVGIGLIGQLAFSGRMILQWLTSEKHRRSVISESFWWFSLIGAALLFSYFVWRQDPVGILGQAPGIVIYARNIRLIYKHKRREARQASDRHIQGQDPEPSIGSGGQLPNKA